jgi:triosephosphate isomerase
VRRKIIAGNWKMNKSCAETREYAVEFMRLNPPVERIDILVCPPFTALATAQDAFNGTGIGLAAQDIFWKNSGAYTGQISAPMLAELGVTQVIVGHSERRGRFGVPEPDFDGAILLHFGDTDSSVNRKARAAHAAGMTPIICVGERIGERRAGQTDEVVSLQTANALSGFTDSEAASLVFAYEPVWAIGTGEVCDAAEANRVCGVIRSTVAGIYGDSAAQQTRIQYGGSVKPDNAEELLRQPEIDGALVGGASLKPADFAAIVLAAP